MSNIPESKSNSNGESPSMPPEKKSKTTKKSSRESGTHRLRRLFRDPQAAYRPKLTIIVLSIVTLFAVGAGLFFITQYDFGDLMTDRPQRLERTPAPGHNTILSVPVEESGALALAGGGDDLFHAVYEKRIVEYRLVRSEEGMKVEQVWSRELPETPTALCFVPFENSERKGELLVAFGNRIETLKPSDANGNASGETNGEANGEGEANARGAGELTPIVTFEEEGTRLTGLACDEDSIFAADYGHGVVHQVDMKGENRREIGTVSEETAFPGFRLGREPFFDLDYSPKHKTLYVANPAAFRVEAFDAATGAWRSEHSWGKYPGSRGGFSGDCNPAVLKILPSGTILTIERGKTPIIRNFDVMGKLLAELTNDGQSTEPFAEGSFFLAAVGRSAEGKNHLLILSNTGKLDLFQEP